MSLPINILSPRALLWTSIMVFQICSLLPLSLYYAFRCSRPHRGYSLHQALARKLMFDLMLFYTRVRWVTAPALSPGNLGKRFVRIKPSSCPEVYQGPLRDADIHPTTISGTWYPSAPEPSTLEATAQRGGGIILHFHGGGYVIGSGRPLDSGYMAGVFNRHIAPLALFVDYRLSCTSKGRFPAALQDAVSSYLFLLDQNVDPKNIILSGDSAGAHLAISLLKYLGEYLPSKVPAPALALLWSPWLDLAAGASATVVLGRKNYETDYIPADFAEWAVASFAPSSFVDLRDPYVTLAGHPFHCATKLWAHVGAQELLHDEVVHWVDEMLQAGCDVSLRVEEGAPHDVVESGHINGFNKEAQEIAKAAGMWCKMALQE